ncbi:hypothetical protein HDZ31DRAFT_78644, partial [Schizophyllum fasciatum]
VKGKERALDPSLVLNDWPAWQCQEWLCSPHVWCSIHHRAELMEELRPVRGRSRRALRSIPSPRQNSAGRIFAASQKRHVSHSSEALQEEEGRPPDHDLPYETSTHNRRRESWASHLFSAAAASQQDQEPPAVQPSHTIHPQQATPSSDAPQDEGLPLHVADYEQSSIPLTLDTLFPPYEPEYLRPVKRPRMDPKASLPQAIALHRLRTLINGPTSVIDVEDAQTLLTALRTSAHLTPHDILLLSSKLLQKVEGWHDGKQGWNRQRQLGEALVPILEPLRGRFAPSSLFDYQHQCMLSEALSLRGDLAEAARLLRCIGEMHGDFQQEDRVLQAYRSLILTASRYYDAARVLDYAVLEWDLLGMHLRRRSHHVSRAGKALRDTTFGILQQLEKPATIFANRPGWTKEQHVHAAEVLLE